MLNKQAVTPKGKSIK